MSLLFLKKCHYFKSDFCQKKKEITLKVFVKDPKRSVIYMFNTFLKKCLIYNFILF